MQLEISLRPLTHLETLAHERALKRAKQYRRDEAELLESIDEVDRMRLFEKLGYTSMSAYCRKELKLSETIGGYFLAVARKSRAVPELKAAITSGALGISTAIQICSVVTSDNQAEWIKKAEELPKSQLEKKVAEANPKKAKRPSAKPVGKDRNRVQFEQSDEFMQMLKRAQDLESHKMGKASNIPETIQAALEAYLDKNDPVKKAERAKKRQLPQPRAGRHPIPAALRHQVNLRDRGQCQVQGPDGKRCGATRFTHTHHIRAVRDGGRNELENLRTVCSAHHRMLHAEDRRMH